MRTLRLFGVLNNDKLSAQTSIKDSKEKAIFFRLMKIEIWGPKVMSKTRIITNCTTKKN